MLKTGAEHLKSLRDGRVVYIGGEKVDDVTTHPAFRAAAGARGLESPALRVGVADHPQRRLSLRSLSDLECPLLLPIRKQPDGEPRDA